MLIKDVEKLIKLAKKQGLTKLKVGDVEFEFDPGHIPSPRGRPKKDSKEEMIPQYSEEDTLLWSVQQAN